MAMIRVDNLSFSYDTSGDVIFDNVNFTIDTDWKLGFVGRNGRGKTTFLKLLLDEEKYTGTITKPVIFDYFPYDVADKSVLTEQVLYELNPLAEQWELMREFSYLDVDEDVYWRPFETLSNGEQTKVLLAALFLNDNHFLLIDEPTNHLDVEGREIVAQYLKSKKGFIVVSHDRRFLDDCVDHILSINRANIEVTAGNFSTWFSNFENQQNLELSQNDQLKKDIRRLNESARQSSGWSDKIEKSKYIAPKSGNSIDRGFVGHKAAKMMQSSKNLEKRQNRAIDEKSSLLKNIEIADDLKISPLTYHSETLVYMTDVVAYYDDVEVFKPVTFEINRGDRIVLNGKNGSGKSTILKLILDESIQHTGVMKIGSNLKISYVSQDTSHLKGNLSDFAYEHNIDESQFKTILRKMDFDRVQFDKNIEDFSGGQKKKVLLAKSLCEEAHLYVWDEPLNFIDIYSRMQIEALLLEYEPTMIFVEHDSIFREKIATKVVEL